MNHTRRLDLYLTFWAVYLQIGVIVIVSVTLGYIPAALTALGAALEHYDNDKNGQHR